jgi:hypothetical protein
VLAERFDNLLVRGPVHDGVLDLIKSRTALAGPQTMGAALHRARWFRQLPETRENSRQILESLLRADPGNAQARREWAAWWLGETKDPQARRIAADQLALAAAGPSGDSSAALLLALLTADPRLLTSPGLYPSQADSPRLRLARAIISERKAGNILYRY